MTFVVKENSPTWEMWHRRYGHIRYVGLQKVLDLKMVDGFCMDQESPN